MGDNDTVKTFVAKLTVDGGDLEGQLQRARQGFAAFSADTKAQATADKAAVAEAVSGQQDLLKMAEAVKSAKEAASKSAIAGTEAEKKVAEEAYTSELSFLEKIKASTKEHIALLVEGRRQQKELAEESKRGGEEGGIGSVVKGFTSAGIKGAAGPGIIGSTLTGLLGGAGLTLGLEAAYEGFEKLIDKMKEFIEDSGGLQKVTDTFQKLTQSQGVNPTEFLEKLRAATHDLVPDLDLLRVANTFMQSGLKMSSEEMVKLTEATVGLARAQGHDAADAIKQLTQSFLSGRSQALGYQTGIQKTLLTLTGLGSTLSQQQKTNISFAQTVKMIEDRYADLGQPLLTYTDRLRQLDVVQKRLFEAIAQGVVTSPGFTTFMESMGKMIERLGGMEGIAEKAGEAIGNAFAALIPLGTQVKKMFEDISAALDKIKGDDTGDDANTYGENNWLNADQLKDQFEKMHPILNALITLFATLGATIRGTATDLKYIWDVGGQAYAKQQEGLNQLDAGIRGGSPLQAMRGVAKIFEGQMGGQIQPNGGPSPLTQQYQKDRAQIDKEKNDAIAEAQSAIQNGLAGPGRSGHADTDNNDPGLARRHALANAQAASQLQQALAKQDLEASKATLEAETEANEAMYKQGDEDAKTYYADKDKLATATRDVTVKAAIEEAAAQKRLLDVQVQQDSKFKDSAEVQKQAIDQQTAAKIEAAEALEQKTKSGDTAGLFGANKEATMKAADVNLQIIKTALAEQVEATKYAFSQNQIDANTYHQQRIDEINAELTAFIAAEQTKQAVMSTAERVISQQKIQEAYAKNQKDLATFGQQFPQEASSNIQSYYSTQLGINKAQQDMAAVTGQGADEAITQQESLLQGYISSLTLANAQVQVGTNEWYKTYEIIQQVRAELAKIQETNAVNNSVTTLMGNTMGALGSAGTGLFTGTFGKGFMSSFSQGANVMQGASALSNQWAAGTDNASDNDPVSAFKDALSDLASGNSGSFKELSQVMTTAVSALGNFAKVIASATSPLGGAFGGGMAGGGLGANIGGSEGVSNALQISQGMGGLLGGIGGAVLGAAMGAIVGEKQQEVQHDIAQIQLTVLQLTEAFSAGTASLNTTIQAMQGVIATLTSEQANSKKGSTQFQDLINQYNQQLTQLEAQQTQTIQQLTQQLASVSSPQSYQQWIQNIDQVIQQYAQFAGAAQNATQLAQANEYLTSSLQNIGQQLGDQIMQEEESAIQNALQLNQLYNQRNQLELQYLNQVQSIMSQGNLTRQRTQAQSAFSQLYDAQVNYSQQLDSINQQINLAQYQLGVEQQIFNLATTKAGLETQLLALQEQGVNEDMQRITAMQNLLATLQSTGYSITNLGALSSSDPNALANQLLQDLVTELNTGQSTMIQQLEQLINVLTEYGGTSATVGSQVPTPNVAGTSIANPNAVTDLFAAAYQARAAFAYGAYRGQNL